MNAAQIVVVEPRPEQGISLRNQSMGEHLARIWRKQKFAILTNATVPFHLLIFFPTERPTKSQTVPDSTRQSLMVIDSPRQSQTVPENQTENSRQSRRIPLRSPESPTQSQRVSQRVQESPRESQTAPESPRESQRKSQTVPDGPRQTQIVTDSSRRNLESPRQPQTVSDSTRRS